MSRCRDEHDAGLSGLRARAGQRGRRGRRGRGLRSRTEVAGRFSSGDRISIAWLRHTRGACRWCRGGREHLCPDSRYSGWDADGGNAELAVVSKAFAHRVPTSFSDEQAAPLLCAGIIGYRSPLRAQLPPGGRLGIEVTTTPVPFEHADQRCATSPKDRSGAPQVST